jgi:hypothetical protein
MRRPKGFVLTCVMSVFPFLTQSAVACPYRYSLAVSILIPARELRIQVKPVAARERGSKVFPDVIQRVSATVAPLTKSGRKTPAVLWMLTVNSIAGTRVPLPNERFEGLCLKRQGSLQA